MRLSVLEEAEIRIVVGIPFETSTIPHVIVPFALILASVSVPHHSLAVSFPTSHLAHVKSISVALFVIVWKLF